MWDRGRVELEHLKVNPVDWLYGWQRRLDRGDAVSFGPAKPHAILGWDFEGPGVVNSSFQASKTFEEGEGLAVTKEMRRAIPVLMEGRKVHLINVYSLCVVPEAAKWFRLLGLTEDTKFQGPLCGSFRMRRFFRSV